MQVQTDNIMELWVKRVVMAADFWLLNFSPPSVAFHGYTAVMDDDDDDDEFPWQYQQVINLLLHYSSDINHSPEFK
jgi:hypothetical protein